MSRLLTYFALVAIAVIMSSLDQKDINIQLDNPNEDSIRNLLYNEKHNTVLKESFLGELYLRDIIQPKVDSLIFQVEFDLHSLDCGAPDCYYNRFTFAIKWDQKKVDFPDALSITNEQGGCIPGETSVTTFRKLETNSNNIIYYSDSSRQHLIFGSEDSKVSYMMCFDETEPDDVDLTNLIQLANDIENEQNAPWRSTQVETIEYELFLSE